MADFTQEAELSIVVPSRELSGAREEIEESLSDIPVSLEGGGAEQTAGDGGPGGVAGGGGVDRQMRRWARQRTEDIGDILGILQNVDENIGAGGGGGGRSGGLLGGLGGDVGVAESYLGVQGARSAASRIGLSGVLSGSGLLAALGIGSGALLADQFDSRRFQQGRPGGIPSMFEHTIGSRIDWRPPEWQGLSGLWENVDLSPPDNLFPDLSPPNDLWPDLSTPDDFWPDLSPPTKDDTATTTDPTTVSGERPSGQQDTIPGSRGVQRSGAVPDVDTPSGQQDTIEGTRGVQRSGAVQRPEVTVNSTNEITVEADPASVEEIAMRAIEEENQKLRRELERSIGTSI